VEGELHISAVGIDDPAVTESRDIRGSELNQQGLGEARSSADHPTVSDLAGSELGGHSHSGGQSALSTGVVGELHITTILVHHAGGPPFYHFRGAELNLERAGELGSCANHAAVADEAVDELGGHVDTSGQRSLLAAAAELLVGATILPDNARLAYHGDVFSLISGELTVNSIGHDDPGVAYVGERSGDGQRGKDRGGGSVLHRLGVCELTVFAVGGHDG